ncbi:MAG: TldD/PmbA family protein [Alphaproteobacteria bacterium]|nr:TldD/PmbA family protein [Alphaproteobacteria bacterium]
MADASSSPDTARALLDDLLSAARRAGADTADASIAWRESLSVDVRLGALEGVEREESRSVGLRALIGKRQAGAATTDLSRAGLAELAERVVAMAKAAPEDPFCGLLDPAERAAGPFPADYVDAANPDAGTLERLACEAEAAALAVAGVTNSSGAGASFDRSRSAYATADGFFAAHEGGSYGLSVAPLAERDGAKERDYEYRTTRRFADLPTPAALGRAAGERAVARLGARKIESRKAPVIFENRIAARLIGPMLGAISGAAVARGVSFLKDKLGKPVFAPGIDIIEDPHEALGLASRHVDGEGAPTQVRKLIDSGVLTTWLLNAAAARQLGLKTTGHATLGHGGPPGISSSNVTLKPGEGDLAALMARAGSGLLVVEFFSPSLNANTGDWSVGVAGRWFENGAPTHAVSEVTVAGNLLDIYARLVPGGDLDIRGALNSPSLLIDDLTIAGL